MRTLAHLGGAPEAAMVGLPVVLLAVFLYLERRARRADRPADDPSGPDEPA